MSDRPLRVLASGGLVVGGAFGLAGSFAPSDALRGLAWGIDGVALVLAAALLTVVFLRRRQDLMAAGFLVFALGEGLVVSGSAMDLAASAPSFGAGAALWSTALALVSGPPVFPLVVRLLGAIASLLFAVTALRVFAGAAITPLTSPLPFFAYPILVATLLGWAWTIYTEQEAR
jgi:hypothetical protein